MFQQEKVKMLNRESLKKLPWGVASYIKLLLLDR